MDTQRYREIHSEALRTFNTTGAGANLIPTVMAHAPMAAMHESSHQDSFNLGEIAGFQKALRVLVTLAMPPEASKPALEPTYAPQKLPKNAPKN